MNPYHTNRPKGNGTFPHLHMPVPSVVTRKWRKKELLRAVRLHTEMLAMFSGTCNFIPIIIDFGMALYKTNDLSVTGVDYSHLSDVTLRHNYPWLPPELVTSTMTDRANLYSLGLWTSLKGTKEELQAIEHCGRMVTENQAILTTLYEYFSALTHRQDGQQKPRNEPIVPEKMCYGPTLLEMPMTGKEISTTIRKLRNRKAKGEDQIPNELLKNGGKEIVVAIQTLFCLCQKHSWTPQTWNKELLKLIPKKGKNSLLNNQSGISLTSNIGKVFVKVLANRLMRETEYRHWLPESQAGLRWGRSVEDNHFILNSMIEAAKLQGVPLAKEIHLLARFVDIYSLLFHKQSKYLHL